MDAALSCVLEAALETKVVLGKLTHTFPAHNPEEEKSDQWHR